MKCSVLVCVFIVLQANLSEGRPGFFEDVARGVTGTVDHLRDQAFRAAQGVHQGIHQTLRIPNWHDSHGPGCGHDQRGGHRGGHWNQGYPQNQYPGNHGYDMYPGYDYNGNIPNQGKPNIGNPAKIPEMKPPQPQPQPPTPQPKLPNTIDKKPPQEEEEEEFSLDVRFGTDGTEKPKVKRSVSKPEGRQLINIMPCPRGERMTSGKCRKVLS